MLTGSQDNKIDFRKLVGCKELTDIRKYVINTGDLKTEPKDIESLDLSESKKF